MSTHLNRRDVLTALPAVVGLAVANAPGRAAEKGRTPGEPFGYCLNTSTISGQKLSLVEEATLAAKAGYHGIEPWIRELDAYVQSGGKLSDLGKQFADLGLSVESVIGFFDWIVDDDARRKRGFEEARRNMEMVRAIGGKRLAAPPAGATDQTGIDFRKAADRYRTLLELGDVFGVVPQVEVWGFSKTLTRLGEAAQVAIDCGHPAACVLPDAYHLYKGGSAPSGLRLLNGSAIHVFHFNDYPSSPPRAQISDAQRVYPGDGVAPLKELVRDLNTIGFKGVLSLELFNRDYWKQDAATVVRTGLEKMRAVVRAALA